MSFNAFVTLVDYFPNIRALRLDSFCLKPIGKPIRSLSRPLRGKFHAGVHINFLGFVDRFTKLDLEYDELIIDSRLSAFERTELIGSGFQISPSTVKLLKLNLQLLRE